MEGRTVAAQGLRGLKEGKKCEMIRLRNNGVAWTN